MTTTMRTAPAPSSAIHVTWGTSTPVVASQVASAAARLAVSEAIVGASSSST